MADVKGYLDLATALFALVAAVFWFLSAYGKVPPMLAYWDATPATDPYRKAVERAARLNSIAAALSGLSASSASQLSDWTGRARFVKAMADLTVTDWTAVAALLIAIYGAFLSTLNFRRAGPNLRFNPRVTGDILQIDVDNYGGRSTTLTKIVIHHFDNRQSWARLRNRATRTSRFVHPTLPYELQPGGVWNGGMPMDRGMMKALYFDVCLYHSHSTKPMRRRVRVRSAPSP